MRLILTTILFSLLCLPVLTTQTRAQTEPIPPKTLQAFVKQGAQIYYLGEYEGMKGWVLIRQGRPEFFYENKARNALVMGLLFNEAGNMMTMAQLNELKQRVGDEMYATTTKLGSGNEPTSITDETPEQTKENEVEAAPASELQEAVAAETVVPAGSQPANVTGEADELASPLIGKAVTPAERMYVDIIKANWFTINPEGDHDVFLFIDPDCPHCQQLIRDIDNFKNAGNFRIRIVPVGIQEDSSRRAAVLLASADPEARIKRYAAGDTDALPAPSTISLDAINANTTLMIKNRFDVTPIVVYRTKQGKVRLVRGRPSDYARIAQDIDEN